MLCCILIIMQPCRQSVYVLHCKLVTTESRVQDKKNGAMLASCVHGHDVKCMFYFPQFNILLTLAQGPIVPWSLMVLTWAVHVVVIMIVIILWSLYEINFALNTTSITMNVP
jgi:hypothetical protein